MPLFEHTATFPFSRETVWNWHARPGAVRRIMPDWEGIRPVEVGGITDGAVAEFRMKVGIVPQRWVAKHYDFVEGEQFCDNMVKGPFGRWNHVHKFVDGGENEMTIDDKIDWRLPFHFFSRIGAPIMVMPRVRTMFKHRSRRILADLSRQQMFKDQPRRRILITGSTGLIGTQLGASPKVASSQPRIFQALSQGSSPRQASTCVPLLSAFTTTEETKNLTRPATSETVSLLRCARNGKMLRQLPQMQESAPFSCALELFKQLQAACWNKSCFQQNLEPWVQLGVVVNGSLGFRWMIKSMQCTF